MIASMSKTGELKELKKDVEQTEDYDMCKAIDMMWLMEKSAVKNAG